MDPQAEVAYQFIHGIDAFGRHRGQWIWRGNARGVLVDEPRRIREGHRPPRGYRLIHKHQCDDVAACGVFQCQNCKGWAPWCFGADDERANWCDDCAAKEMA